MRPSFSMALSCAQSEILHSSIARMLAGLLVLAAVSAVRPCIADDSAAADVAARIASNDLSQRMEAIREAGQLGPAASVAVPQLIDALKADELSVRYAAINALAAIGPSAAAAADPLTEVLSSDLDLLRFAAVSALRQVADNGNQELLERLRKLAAQDSALHVRVAAARAVAALAGDGQIPEPQSDVVKTLVEGISSDDDHVSSDAIHGLAAVGSSAAGPIVPLLESPEGGVRANAADALAILGLSAHSAAPALIKSLESADPLSTRHLLRALAAVGSDPQAAIPAVLKTLGAATTDDTRVTALRTLGEFGAGAGPAVSAVAGLLESDDPRLRMEAAQTLGEIGSAASAAVPALMKSLQGDDGLLTITAAQSLSHIGAPAVAPLQKLLNEPGYQLLVATILGDIGPDAAGAVPELVKLIKSENEDVRRAALLALAGIGPGAASAADTLTAVLNDPDSPARTGAAYALARIGTKEAVDDLQKVVQESDDERLKMTAAWALVILDPENAEADQAVPALVAGLDDPWELVRRECVTALAALGPRAQSAVENVRPLLDDPDPQVRAEALIALTRMGADLQNLLPHMIEGLSDESLETRYACAYVLGQSGQNARQAVPQLKELLNHRREFDRIIAAWALARIDPSPANRQAAVPLMMIALTNSSERVRQEAATTLGLLGDKSPAVLEALRAAAKDASPQVQKAAQQSLEQLSGT